MKLPTRKLQTAARASHSSFEAHGDPPGVVPSAANPFEGREADHVWVRTGSGPQTHELVVQLRDGRVFMGSFWLLKGFYDDGVPRRSKRKPFFENKLIAAPRRGSRKT